MIGFGAWSMIGAQREIGGLSRVCPSIVSKSYLGGYVSFGKVYVCGRVPAIPIRGNLAWPLCVLCLLYMFLCPGERMWGGG